MIYKVVLGSGVQKSDSEIYIYTHSYIFFFIFFSIKVFYRILQYPVLYNRTLLFIYFIYNSLFLLIPNS